MARLTDPNGSVVNVEDDFAKALVESHGYEPADDTKKAPAKKPASSKTND